MRAIGLAIVGLVLFAPSASAATVKLEVIFCSCDGSSGDADILNIIVTAAPGEHNAVGVERFTRGIVITDEGAPLTGDCRPTRSGGGRFCAGSFDSVDVDLGDGDDTHTHRPRMPVGACLIGTARTRRGDGLETVTTSRSTIGCLPVPRLRPRVAG